MDIDELQRILELMKEFDIAEVDIKEPESGRRIRLKKAQAIAHYPVMAPVPATPVAAPSAPAPAPGAPAPAGDEPAGEEDPGNLVEIPSPMVGTFYQSPSPDSDPFVEVGDMIDEETVVCIVEAMKVMNEIKSEVAGEVVEVLVRNGEAVEFGQPLLLVRTE